MRNSKYFVLIHPSMDSTSLDHNNCTEIKHHDFIAMFNMADNAIISSIQTVHSTTLHYTYV